jgi:hypothetical protein
MKSRFSAGYGIDGQQAVNTREPAAMSNRQPSPILALQNSSVPKRERIPGGNPIIGMMR